MFTSIFEFSLTAQRMNCFEGFEYSLTLALVRFVERDSIFSISARKTQVFLMNVVFILCFGWKTLWVTNILFTNVLFKSALSTLWYHVLTILLAAHKVSKVIDLGIKWKTFHSMIGCFHCCFGHAALKNN